MLEEVFRIDPEFERRHNALLIRQPANGSPSSFSALALSLLSLFGCRAIALVARGSSSDLLSLVCYPPTEGEWAEETLMAADVIEKVDLLVDNPSAINQTLSHSKQGQLVEVDVIVLPRERVSENCCGPVRLFVLLDAAALAPAIPDAEERRCQRGILAQFLVSWWILACAQVVDLAKGIGQAYNRVGVSEEAPSCLQIANFAQLLAHAVKAARSTRSNATSMDGAAPLPVSTDGYRIAWDEWYPIIPDPPRGLSNENLSCYRESAQAVLYWAQWVGAQNDLEEERVSGGAS